MQRVISTDGIPPREQFDFWRETACRHFYLFSPIGMDPGQGYQARLAASQFGEFSLVDFDAPPHDWRRLRPEVTRSDDETYVLVQTQPQAGALIRLCDGREMMMDHGMIGMSGSDTRVEARHLGRGALRLLKFPKSVLDPLLPPRARGRLPQNVIAGTPGLGAVILPYFDALMREIPRLDPAATETALRHLVGLIGLHQSGTPGADEAGHAALRAAKLAEAQQHVGRHLGDPALDAARTAAALRISVRQLSSLFEPTGESFARHVMRRRLDCARALLTGPGAADRKVADIAFACGFDSLATFYRAFRRAYGAAPSELRDAA